MKGDSELNYHAIKLYEGIKRAILQGKTPREIMITMDLQLVAEFGDVEAARETRRLAAAMAVALGGMVSSNRGGTNNVLTCEEYIALLHRDDGGFTSRLIDKAIEKHCGKFVLDEGEKL